jgi:porin-like protein
VTRVRKLRDALLGSSAIIALAAGPALAEETEDLKAQIERLRSRLDQLEKQQGATDAKVDAKQAAAPADAVVGGDFPSSFKLPGSDTSMAIHGYTKLDILFDVNQQASDSFDVTGIAPNGSTAERRGDQVRIHTRESRLTFETRTPTNYGQLQTFIQGDFFDYGTSATQFVSNSDRLRIKHAYGVLGPVLAGQTWTNFFDADDFPETLDFEGPSGQVYIRQGQLRYTQALGKFALSGSIENPQGDATANNGCTSSGSIPKSATDGPCTTPGGVGVNNIDRAPDLTVRGVYTDSWGHISVAGLGRRFETDNGGGDATGLANQSASAWGGAGDVSGTINIGSILAFAPVAKDAIGFDGFYGSGLGRYVAIGGAAFEAAVIKNFGTTAVREETQPVWGGYLWYMHSWTDTLRSNFVGGVQENHWSDAILNPGNSTLTDRIITGHANLIWSPIKSVNFGVEYMWGERDFHKSPVALSGTAGNQKAGNDSRIQLSAQYLF